MHTGPIPTVVTADITMNLVIGADLGMPVPAVFGYSAHEPLSVTATFSAGDTEVEWVFARDLLQGGTDRPAGDGDVTCWPTTIAGEPLVCIALRSPSGQALLEAPADEIDEFLRRSYEVVPAGSESDFLDLDTLIESLLSN
ncbi:MAG: SsgA family sporulation/cell division regulator [Candidatus Nanopelagicales bacterium]